MTAPPTKQHHREQWSSQYGFLLAAIGSAIGLGNIWRFPGVAYENGGGAFIVPYLVALLTAGIPVLLLDYALGHRYRGSAPATFRRLGRPFEALGWFQVGIAFIITTYYACVIAWAVRYIGFSVNEAWGDDTAAFFVGDFLQAADPGISFDIVPAVFWPLLFVWIACLVIIALGVKSGLERANKIFLPLLVLLFGILVVRALLLPGAIDGLSSFFTPEWGALADPQVWIAAYAQIFFSLSIAFGIMITYASYLRRRSNLAPTAYVAAFANSSFEILAGIGVFATLGYMASVQNVGVSELEGITGVSLSFMTFPQIISQMPGGPIFGILFFTSLVLAGLTSLISVLQVVSAAFQEKLGLGRVTAALIIGGTAGILSLLLYATTTGLPLLDTVDKYINEIGVVSSAILTCALVAYVARRLPQLQAHLNDVSTARVGGWWRVLIGVVVPVVLVYMLVATIIALIHEPYSGYPNWFLTAFGWGAVGLAALVGVLGAALRWRRPVDDFRPDDVAVARRGGAATGEVNR